MYVQARGAGILLVAVAYFAVGFLPKGEFFSGSAGAVDYWTAASNPAISTNNDCGQVAVVSGKVQIRRSFQSDTDTALPLGLADRIHSGDILEVPAGSRVEWTSGYNLVAVAGGNSRVRFNGLRNFVDSDGKPAMRLDLTLLNGELRVQVRLNLDQPESVLTSLTGSEVLMKRGDVCLVETGQWRCGVLSGEGWGRLIRGTTIGEPFTIAAGNLVGTAGNNELTGKDIAAIKARLPFSFELERLAKPPEPSMGGELEAP